MKAGSLPASRWCGASEAHRPDCKYLLAHDAARKEAPREFCAFALTTQDR